MASSLFTILIMILFGSNPVGFGSARLVRGAVAGFGPVGSRMAAAVGPLKTKFLSAKIALGEKEEDLARLELPALPNKLPTNENKPSSPQKLTLAGFELPAQSGAVIDERSGRAIFEKDADRRMPIASITKLMTALVFLEHNPGWDATYKIRPEDKREGGRIYLFPGDTVRVRDLFHSSLVASDNIATLALAESTGMTEAQFVEKMNEKSKAMGLVNTSFKDPIGLNDDNVSTAKEIAIFAGQALSDPDISGATLMKKYGFQTLEGRKKTVYSTDDLLDIFPQNGVMILGGKTGYTDPAGYCFVGKFIDHSGHAIISVVLKSSTYKSRFEETHGLVNWIFNNFQWQ